MKPCVCEPLGVTEEQQMDLLSQGEELGIPEITEKVCFSDGQHAMPWEPGKRHMGPGNRIHCPAMNLLVAALPSLCLGQVWLAQSWQAAILPQTPSRFILPIAHGYSASFRSQRCG